jgi:hypothetical protein
LYNIITDEEKRKKLVVYINPPYAEGDNVRGIGRKNVHISKTHDKYQKELGKASGELFAQFFIRIYKEIPNCVLAEFSKLKILQAPNFSDFREVFRAKLEKLFVVPAKTFDNVTGEFPIGFFIWNLGLNETFDKINSDVFDKNGNFIQTKYINSYDGLKYISNWLEINSKNISKNHIGHMSSVGNDFQNQRMVFIDDVNAKRKNGGRHTMISVENLIIVSIYFAVRHCIEATWLNDRDQFLFPNDKWKSDSDFQNDCLAFTLFSNNIQSQFGTNHWIPFTEAEVNARSKFKSNFMTDFINGKVKIENQNVDLFSQQETLSEFETLKGLSTRLQFSEEAKLVFDAGRNLWKYYHTQEFPSFRGVDSNAVGRRGVYNVNASLYDIREHFQGRNEKGKMNNKSEDETYMRLIAELRSALKILAKKIEPKVYEYGFLKE